MINFILDIALFFVVLFFLLPVTMVAAMVMRDAIYRKDLQSHKLHAEVAAR